MTGWEDYLAAARRLDGVRRSAATVRAEQDEAMRAAREDLTGVRQRVTLQQARFAEIAGRHRVRLPSLSPADSDVNAALVPGSGPTAVLAALHHARSTLDTADAELTLLDGPGAAERSPAVRNLTVYGAFALLILVLQLILFVVTPEESLPLLAPICGLALPLLAFGLGWLAVGLVYPATPVDRTPLVGAMVCLVVPVLLTCAGFGVFALVH